MRIIIVEDERITRDGLARLLSQMEDVTICAKCKNAKEGFDQILKHRPDGVITDIVMEGESGLEMIERCRDYGVNCAFVLLSGYSEFEYARQALKLQVFDYLSKPLDFQSMEDVIARLKKVISEEQSKADRSVELLTGMVSQAEVGSDVLKGRSFYTIAMNYYRKSDGKQVPDVGEQISRQAASKRLNNYHHCMEIRGFHCILVTADDNIDDFCCELQNSIVPGNSLHVGISSRFEDIEKINTAIGQAIVAAQACGLEDVTLLRADLLPYQIMEYPDALFAREFACIRDNLYQMDATSICTSVFPVLDGMLLALPPYALFAFLRRCLREIGWNIEGEHSEDQIEETYSFIDSAPNLYWLKERFKEIVQEQLTLMRNRRGYKSEDSLSRAIGYVDMNYAHAIRSADVARQFGMESTYFSKQFKKRTGMNYNDYVTQLRMKRAMRLLELGSYTVAEVAQMVGYQSQRHFSHLFREYTGKYPSDVQRGQRE